MCFQYTTKLRHNVVYVFSIFNGDVITPNLGNYRTDMTISSTALNQSKLLNYFQSKSSILIACATSCNANYSGSTDMIVQIDS